ncbi:hypothetical protein F6X40_24100 [Paraburkholderia sp. UCT31]|uniref:hypothetical protein n=1 Tax=Paraburkholderia sp. UCT31 TaxID=2615209 RepID=UPI0016552F30|nr:hypothetical protein [Paraburkholderia sp. UCT31]MBC8739800.1 hypothetical protein [Paraburkholderia sp. UCT31]
MRRIALLGASLVATLLCACSSVPMVEHGPYSPQLKSQSVQAWESVADKVAFHLAKAADEAGVPATDRAVFLPAAGSSKFQQGLRELLVTDLTARGFEVVADPNRASIGFFENSIFVKHSSDTPSVSPITGLAYVLTLGLAFDPWNDPTYSEVLLTSTATRKGAILMRDEQSFYVRPDDAHVYDSSYR